ncbi:MAG: DUF4147 domain-containing protein [Anaerolineales bacterium]|nr:DUF4147 domain-containing protein [Anaerolineales bacterium]
MILQTGRIRSLEGSSRGSGIHRILDAVFESADPRLAVVRNLKLDGNRLTVGDTELLLEAYNRIRLVGLGKASVAMAQGALEVLGDRIDDGYLVSKHAVGDSVDLPEQVHLVQGNHPVPGEGSLNAALGLEAFLGDSRKGDMVLCMISGGGSSLASLPAEGVSLGDIQALTRLLLSCGASINEINTLRKHLDRIKGGGLARMAAPAQLATLILSDVIGNPLDVIASGPTVADESTYAEALGVLEKYSLSDKAPEEIVGVLQRGVRGELPETVKHGGSCLEGGIHVLVGSNQAAVEAAVAQASEEGFNTLLQTTSLQGEASRVGFLLAKQLRELDRSGQPLSRPACIIAGGETTVTLHGSGLGGRNTELALGAAEELAGLSDVMLITLASDGEDGTGDAAGAVVTGDTLAEAASLGLDPQAYLQDNDSYHFFDSLGDLLKTGPTGTNVNDLVFLFAF